MKIFFNKYVFLLMFFNKKLSFLKKEINKYVFLTVFNTHSYISCILQQTNTLICSRQTMSIRRMIYTSETYACVPCQINILWAFMIGTFHVKLKSWLAWLSSSERPLPTTPRLFTGGTTAIYRQHYDSLSTTPRFLTDGTAPCQLPGTSFLKAFARWRTAFHSLVWRE